MTSELKQMCKSLRLAHVAVVAREDDQRIVGQARVVQGGQQHADLGIDMAPHMPTDPANAQNTFLFNYEWWADNRDDLDAKFQAWLAR